MCNLEGKECGFGSQNRANSLLFSLGNCRRKVSARLPAPPHSLNCRELPLALRRSGRTMPVFRDSCSETDRRKRSTSCWWQALQPFSLEDIRAAGFSGSIMRMQCDHNAMMRRKRPDFCRNPPRSTFGGFRGPFLGSYPLADYPLSLGPDPVAAVDFAGVVPSFIERFQPQSKKMKTRYTMVCGPSSKSADPADARETSG
jgi:hypothetical protein